MDYYGDLRPLDGTISGSLSEPQSLSGSLTVPSSTPGATSYNQLKDKPTINAVTVEGDKLGIDYKLQDKMNELTVQEIEKILYLG